MEETCDSGSNKFIWKQVLEGGIKFQLGSVRMTKMDGSCNCILSFLEHLTTQMDNFKKELKDARDENSSMFQEQEEMKKRLANYVIAKDALEQDLYTKFSLVLNQKKARIRELKEQVSSGITKETDS